MAEKIASELAEAISLIECEFLTEFLIRDSSITAALSFGMTAWGDKGLEGKYKANSVKAVDGAKFHYLLQPYMNEEKEVTFPAEITSKIDRRQINLTRNDSIFPRNIHIVFIRNVFVYFTVEMRKNILQKIVNDSLAPGGYIFLSMNEIATIDSTIIPAGIEKCSDGNVFYFHKKG